MPCQPSSFFSLPLGQKVKNGSSTFGVGHLTLQYNYYQAVDFSVPLYPLDVVLCAPKPRPLKPYLNLLRPFSHTGNFEHHPWEGRLGVGPSYVRSVFICVGGILGVIPQAKFPVSLSNHAGFAP